MLNTATLASLPACLHFHKANQGLHTAWMALGSVMLKGPLAKDVEPVFSSDGAAQHLLTPSA
jgi:hypothetical protein